MGEVGQCPGLQLYVQLIGGVALHAPLVQKQRVAGQASQALKDAQVGGGGGKGVSGGVMPALVCDDAGF